MSNIMKNFILLSLPVLVISAIGVSFAPATAAAEGGRNYIFTTPGNPAPDPVTEEPMIVYNPEPAIRAIAPKSAARGEGMVNITVTGRGFIPSSVARINGTNRPTTFVDGSHLLVQINTNEPYTTENGFYVSVANGEPGGGFSNAVFFALKGDMLPLSPGNAYPNTYNPGAMNQSGYGANGQGLASSVILGGASFLPSGLIQWVLTAIILLFIVILVRKIFGGRERYDTTPLKHA